MNLSLFSTRSGRLLSALLLITCVLPDAAAHLMVAQRGTVNIVGDNAYTVLSLPVSAFQGLDDDGDGLSSARELAAHRTAIEAQIQQGARLWIGDESRSLQDVVIQLSPPEHGTQAEASQLIVLGRFALPPSDQALALELTLWGQQASEQTQDITVTRDPLSQLLHFAPGHERRWLLSADPSGAAAPLELGSTHVRTDLDPLLRLLLLLVVLVTLVVGWNFHRFSRT